MPIFRKLTAQVTKSQITIDQRSRETLRRLGDGNLSLGVRVAAALVRAAPPEKIAGLRARMS